MESPKAELSSASTAGPNTDQNDDAMIVLRSSAEEQVQSDSNRGWRFWVMFPGLGLAAALTALDTTVLSTALPTVVNDLHSNELFIWLLNSYTLAWTAVQPVYGQAADIFGRKATILGAIIFFMIGSIICALAGNTGVMIAGRVIQGLGAGGISVLPSLIICDLVPQRERQKFIGVLYATFAIGTDLGPVISGVMIDHIGWRWIFWINLPVSGAAFILIAVSLKVNHARTSTIMELLGRIDLAGNAILMLSMTSILLALAEAGTVNPWNSSRTLLPLIIGFLGLVSFIIFQSCRWCKYPMMPLRLFTNRSSLIGYTLTFLHGVLLYWVLYFLPVYFQAVLQETPQQSGIDMLPTMAPFVPFAIIGGTLISRSGRYKFNQLIGFALMSIGVGCFTLLDQNSSKAEWIVFQLIFGAGFGFLMTAALPAIQAPLAEADVAMATATWGFIQSFGYIWGASIPSSIFSTQFTKLLPKISDPSAQRQLIDGGAFEHASKAFVGSFTEKVKSEVIDVYVLSLKLVWQVCIAFAVIAFLASVLVKEIELKKVLETKFGYNNQKKRSSGSEIETPEQMEKGETDIY